MSKIAGIILVLCVIHCSSAGIVPKFVWNAAKNMVPDGVTKIVYNIPDEEVIAAKRFVLEADLKVDPDKIEYLRNVLFQTLLKSAQDPKKPMQYLPAPSVPQPQKPSPEKGFISSTINSALNSAVQTVQPKFSVALKPQLSFE